MTDRFRGCLLGAAVGDVAGAAVEAESAAYIAKTFASVDDILATETVAEFSGPEWRVGRFTDDTQMTLGVADWLIHDPSHSPEALLVRLAAGFERWRRYGPSTAFIFDTYASNRAEWRSLATASYPWGSYGNGSATRVSPVGLAFRHQAGKLVDVAVASSRPTHSHPLAYQGAALQAVSVAMAATAADGDAARHLSALRACLDGFASNLQDTSAFSAALDAVERGLRDGTRCLDMAEELGTGVTAVESVPMAIYCFLRHSGSYERAVGDAVFTGGDTDTIAAMTGAMAGASLGVEAIPARWLSAIREPVWNADVIANVADSLSRAYG